MRAFPPSWVAPSATPPRTGDRHRGVGIAPADHARVFEQFGQAGDTLTDKPRGTGLGLAICREIVEHHGGRLWLESDVGQGARFSFTLPISAEAIAVPAESQPGADTARAEASTAG